MTNKELILETIEYYRTNPRGIDTNNDRKRACYYKSPTGNMCAIGRKIDWNKVNISIERLNAFGSIDGMGEEDWESLHSFLQDDVLMIPFDLWIELQQYHDYTLAGNYLESDLKNIEEKMLKRW